MSSQRPTAKCPRQRDEDQPKEKRSAGQMPVAKQIQPVAKEVPKERKSAGELQVSEEELTRHVAADFLGLTRFSPVYQDEQRAKGKQPDVEEILQAWEDLTDDTRRQWIRPYRTPK